MFKGNLLFHVVNYAMPSNPGRLRFLPTPPLTLRLHCGRLTGWGSPRAPSDPELHYIASQDGLSGTPPPSQLATNPIRPSFDAPRTLSTAPTYRLLENRKD